MSGSNKPLPEHRPCHAAVNNRHFKVGLACAEARRPSRTRPPTPADESDEGVRECQPDFSNGINEILPAPPLELRPQSPCPSVRLGRVEVFPGISMDPDVQIREAVSDRHAHRRRHDRGSPRGW